MPSRQHASRLARSAAPARLASQPDGAEIERQPGQAVESNRRLTDLAGDELVARVDQQREHDEADTEAHRKGQQRGSGRAAATAKRGGDEVFVAEMLPYNTPNSIDTAPAAMPTQAMRPRRRVRAAASSRITAP